ncbi:EcKinase 1 [Fopius arisanus]|nr:EcKinase 1 [Fopius arisanus]
MELVAPDWLNAEFIQRVLKNSENDDSIEITEMTTKPATNKGDNYTSDMHRSTVEFTRDEGGRKVTEKRSIIVKVAPTTEGQQKDLVEQADLFGVEIQMMTTTLHEMQVLLPETKISGKCLYTQSKNPPLLVIEDLAPLGFRMADREAGLDLDHCILAVRGLAKFHASSIAVYEKSPECKTRYNRGIFNTDNPPEMRTFFTNGMKSLGRAVEHWPKLGTLYADKIAKVADVVYERASNCRIPNESDFNVINHGDFWVNNMLFAYDDNGKVTRHIFVDFQLCVYGSPAIDLNYFLNTSPSETVLLSHRDHLIDEYLKVLTATMRRIGCKVEPPSLDELKEAVYRMEVYGMLAACTILPIVLVDKKEAQNLDEIMGQDEASFNNKAYENPKYKETMSRRLPKWEAMGLLD